jgi:hypothetical protein
MGVVASAASYDREGLTGLLTTHLPLRFSRPYADSGTVLVISSRSSVRRLEDLHGQKIGVMVGTVEHEWLVKHGFRVSVFASQEDIILECFSRASPSGRCAACSRGCCGGTSGRAADTSADLCEVCITYLPPSGASLQ